jgi:hypothetical protein
MELSFGFRSLLGILGWPLHFLLGEMNEILLLDYFQGSVHDLE